MRKVLQAALLFGVFAAPSFSQQSPDRIQAPERLFLHPQDRPEIVPPEVFADRDPVRVDPQHFKLDFQNERVRVVRFTMKGSEGSPMHEAPDILVVCLKECRVRLTRPDREFRIFICKPGIHGGWEDTRSEEKPQQGAVGNASHRDETNSRDQTDPGGQGFMAEERRQVQASGVQLHGREKEYCSPYCEA
jgi:hypothetical protein